MTNSRISRMLRTSIAAATLSALAGTATAVVYTAGNEASGNR